MGINKWKHWLKNLYGSEPLFIGWRIIYCTLSLIPNPHFLKRKYIWYELCKTFFCFWLYTRKYFLNRIFCRFTYCIKIKKYRALLCFDSKKIEKLTWFINGHYNASERLIQSLLRVIRKLYFFCHAIYYFIIFTRISNIAHCFCNYNYRTPIRNFILIPVRASPCEYIFLFFLKISFSYINIHVPVVLPRNIAQSLPH